MQCSRYFYSTSELNSWKLSKIDYLKSKSRSTRMLFWAKSDRFRVHNIASVGSHKIPCKVQELLVINVLTLPLNRSSVVGNIFRLVVCHKRFLCLALKFQVLKSKSFVFSGRIFHLRLNHNREFKIMILGFSCELNGSGYFHTFSGVLVKKGVIGGFEKFVLKNGKIFTKRQSPFLAAKFMISMENGCITESRTLKLLKSISSCIPSMVVYDLYINFQCQWFFFTCDNRQNQMLRITWED